MITIHLQIEEDYIDTFMMTLPKEYVRVVEKDFNENKELLKEELNLYKTDISKFIPYYDSMKNITTWLEEKKR